MKRIRPISFALLTVLLLILACGPVATPEVTEPIQDAVDTAVALTRMAQDPATEAAAPITDTPAPIATDTPVPIPTDTPEPSPTPFCDRASFVSESIPDGMEFEPDTPYSKSWRLSNTGACTWTSGYSLVFDHGDMMSAPTIVPLGGTVVPGQEVDVTVDMVSPSGEGTYTGHWMLRNDAGVLFGLGSNANLTFWVEIDVVEPPPIVMIMPDIIIPLFPGGLLPRTELVHNPTTLTPGAMGFSEASCPSGTVVVGGGFAAGIDFTVYSSYPVAGGWRIYAKNNHATIQVFNAYAICLHNTQGSSAFESSLGTIDAGKYATIKATCPTGSIVTGGGFVSTPSRHWVVATRKSGTGWEVRARNMSAVDYPLTAYAVCLSGVNALTSQVFAQATIPGGTAGGGQVACPANTLVTGGGHYLSSDVYVYRSTMKPSDDSMWNAFGRNRHVWPRLINVYATCLSFQ